MSDEETDLPGTKSGSLLTPGSTQKKKGNLSGMLTSSQQAGKLKDGKVAGNAVDIEEQNKRNDIARLAATLYTSDYEKVLEAEKKEAAKVLEE